MRKNVLGLGIFVVLALGLTGVVTADQATVTVKGLSIWGYPLGELAAGTQVQWEIRTVTDCWMTGGDEVDVFITTRAEFLKAVEIGAMAYNDPPAWEAAWTAYVKEPAITEHKGTFTVPFTDSWVVFIYTSGGCTVEVTYDFRVGEGDGDGVPGFT